MPAINVVEKLILKLHDGAFCYCMCGLLWNYGGGGHSVLQLLQGQPQVTQPSLLCL